MDTKLLRQKILDLAIHGRLVPQDPNDEPASALLARIRQEKEQLVKDGKLKKKDLVTTPVSDEDKPFEVPEGWEWVTIKQCISLKSGTNIKVRANSDLGDYPIYGGNGVNGYYNSYNVEQGTLIIGRVGFHCGSVHLTQSKAWVTDNALIVTKDNSYDNKFLYYLLSYLDLGRTSNSTAQPVVSGKGILPLLIPLPPLAEQKRIVAKVEQWMSLVDIIESGKENLQQSIALAKNKILDLAIKGKLVEKEGEWEEKTLGEVCTFIADGDWIEKKDQSSYGIRLVQTGNIGNGVFKAKDDSCRFISEETFNTLSCTEIFAGDLLISRLPEPLGRSCIVPETGQRMITAVDCTIIRPASIIDIKYLCYYTQSSIYQQQIHEHEAGTTRKRISRKNLEKISIPLPPLSEQHRIVAKVEELFAAIEQIQKNI